MTSFRTETETVSRVQKAGPFYCRAMLCVSAVYAVMRCLCVCLSVRLSRSWIMSKRINKHILEIFSPSGSHTILVFPHQTGWRYSDGNPHNGGVECRWSICRNSDFGLIRTLLDVRSAKNLRTTKLSIRHSRPRTTGYRSIAGRANYEVTKTVTDNHAV